MNFLKNALTTEKHRLAEYGSLCGEKQFLLIFISFYWFDQKDLFNLIQSFLRIFPFQADQEKQTI